MTVKWVLVVAVIACSLGFWGGRYTAPSQPLQIHLWPIIMPPEIYMEPTKEPK